MSCAGSSRRSLAAMVLLVSLVGCRRRDAEPTPGPTAPAPGPTEPARAPTEPAPAPTRTAPVEAAAASPSGDILVDARETPPGSTIPEYKQVPLRVDPAGLSRLLPSRPGLPVPFSSVTLGKPIDEALVAGKRPSSGPLPNDPYRDWWPPPDHPGMLVKMSIAHFGDTDGTTQSWVTSADVLLPRGEARRLVTGVWGEPTTTIARGNARIPVWIDVEGGFHARLLDDGGDDRLSVLEILPYLTLERLLGPASDRFGFEARPSVGMTVADVLAAAPAEQRARRDTLGLTLELPPVELEDTESQAHLQAEQGRVTVVMLFVPYSLRSRVEALVAKKGPTFRVEDGGSFLRIHYGISRAPDAPVEEEE